MFFYLSKVLAFVLQPSSCITLVLLAGTALVLTGRQPVWSRRLLVAGVGALLLCGFSPLGQLVVLPLEQRFQRPELPETVAGILILGGFEVSGISNARGQLTINEAGERLTEALVLAHRRPTARVVFTGGDGTILGAQPSAANSVGGYLRAVGIAPERIVLEDRSRTTYENALYLAAVLKPRPGERYVLVTSAFHMPRAVGTFRQQGFDVVPWPVDYRTRGGVEAWEWSSNLADGLERVDFSLREWAGLIGYRLSGRSNAYWPGRE